MTSCKTCVNLPVCIDPCDGCPNFDVTDENGNLLAGKDYCSNEQGSPACRKIIGVVCTDWEEKTPENISRVKKVMEMLG